MTRACFPCICINEVWVTRKITTRGSNQQFQIKFFSIKREYLRKHCLMPKALITHQAMAKNHLKAKIAKNITHVQRNRLHIGLLCRYANSSMSTQQTKLRITEDKMINKQFFPANCLKSTTTSLLGAKNSRFSCFRRDKETFTCRQVSFTGHIPQVKVQVTVLQINKQAQKCLLAVITIQNFFLDQCETVWLSYRSTKQ